MHSCWHVSQFVVLEIDVQTLSRALWYGNSISERNICESYTLWFAGNECFGCSSVYHFERISILEVRYSILLHSS